MRISLEISQLDGSKEEGSLEVGEECEQEGVFKIDRNLVDSDKIL